MKPQTITRTSVVRLVLLGFCIALASCNSLPDTASNAILGGTGAYLGHEIGNGEPEGALLGAVAGVATGAVLNRARERGREKAYTSGYDKGRSDEVKRLYWVQKNLHRGDEFAPGFGGGTSLTPSFYEIPMPEHVSSDGTIIEAHSQIIEVLEP